MTHEELAEKYINIEKMPLGIERRVRLAHVNLQFEVFYADTQVADARRTLQYAIANDHDVQSIQGWLDNMKRAAEHKAMLEDRIGLLERIIDEQSV